MQKWEYYVVPASFEEKARDFYLDIESKGKVYGLEEMCDYYGERDGNSLMWLLATI